MSIDRVVCAHAVRCADADWCTVVFDGVVSKPVSPSGLARRLNPEAAGQHGGRPGQHPADAGGDDGNGDVGGGDTHDAVLSVPKLSSTAQANPTLQILCGNSFIIFYRFFPTLGHLTFDLLYAVTLAVL